MRQAAHDLGNLLTVISGYRDLAQRDLAHAMDRLQRAREAEERAMQLVRSMLTQNPPSPAGVFDVVEVARELISLLDSGEILGRDVKLVFTHWIAPLHVQGEGLAFLRVLLNLCMNAQNATANTITIETGVKGIGCWISLEDNGTGIEMAELSALWERPESSEGEHGHGLAIVRKTVKKMGGSVSFASKPGEGTKFVITLPLCTGTVAS
jgi:signal transduction histidine kinase